MKYISIFILFTFSLCGYAQGDIEFVPEDINGKISLKVKSYSSQTRNIVVMISGPGCNVVPSGHIKVNLLPNETKEIANITAVEGYECDFNVTYKEEKSVAAPVDKLTHIAMNDIKVNVFVKNDCQKCQDLMDGLKKANIAAIDLNVDMHKPNYDLLLQAFKKTGTTIIKDMPYPVVVYNGKIHQNIVNIESFIAGLK
jgi:glutaredoxin